MTPPFRVEMLGAGHDRESFDCGVEALDRYIRDLASQDMRRMVSKCHVACPAGATTIAGYYTLAAAEVAVSALPETTTRKLPRYPTVPVVRMGRLAVDRRHRGVGLGAALIINAVTQVLHAEIAAFALVVDAKDDAAAAFYESRGFVSIADRVLVLPLATARKALRDR
ncbi:GNAT family N-acetyltransferase [Methylorubrum podarium]|uniref:GNAT family N-acetyltransferase n=1 Tax=Methylorubrum podarium TaxID=200476 RepID=A0ABV1QMJ8_9HYPH